MTRFVALSMLLSFAIAPLPALAQWGHLEGQILATGEIDNLPADETRLFGTATRGVGNVFIYLREAPATVHSGLAVGEDDAVDFAMQANQFVPHAMIVRTGQTVHLNNHDAIVHNVHTFPFRRGNDSINCVVAPNQGGVPVVMYQPESRPIQVRSDIQPQMSAYWMVVDHPYAVVTDEEGRFRIENVPAGTHRFRIWHERLEFVEPDLQVTITDGATTTASIEVPVNKFFAE